MRTTVDIDEDVLLTVKEIAARRKVAMGRVLSDLARQALSSDSAVATSSGWPLFPVRPGVVVTMELVNQLRDEEP